MGRLLLILGLVSLVVGGLFLLGSRLGLGHLPGDLVFQKGSFKLYVPLATSLLLSVIITVLLWLFHK